MKVAVTGGSGFIGQHVVSELLRRGHLVRIVDCPTTAGKFASQERLTFFPADLTEFCQARAALDDFDAIIALAAASAGVRVFNASPATMLDVNVRIVANTFKAAALTASIQKHAPRIVYVSSSCVFDRCATHVATEELLLHAAAPAAGYPLSKFIGEQFCRAYAEQHALPYTIVRPFNVYGPGEIPGDEPGKSHVIPDLVKKILGGQYPLEVYGDGTQTRAFTFVNDVARGIVAATESPRAAQEDFNLGHPRETSITELAQRLWKACGRTEPLRIRPTKGYKIDVARRSVDSEKARRLLNWIPEVDLSDGIERYVNWYRLVASADQFEAPRE